ncbi:MAG: alkaline phosphatase PhoX [Chthoniobacterales bacterium]
MRRCILALGAIVALSPLTNAAPPPPAPPPLPGPGPKIFDKNVSGVPAANPEMIVDNTLSPEFHPGLIVEGLDLLENPSGSITKFGYLSDGTHTEPDENTYLILDHNPGGPTPGYDYGRHFLFQGHEIFAGNLAYVTRINLDVSHPDHRITLLTPGDANGLTNLNAIDGSTWDPFSQTLLFAEEAGALDGTGIGGVVEMSADWDPVNGRAAGLRTLYGSMGRGGFEGIHPDDQGNIWIAEDTGGTTLMNQPNGVGNFGRNPNSFIFRFVPTDPADLSHGKLQAVQVSINGSPITFIPMDGNHPTGDVLSNNQLLLHTVGASYPISWVTVHDTAVNGTDPFDASAAAKVAGATPFKRPENGQFQPGSHFQTFFFCITGDTDNRASSQSVLAARGSWGGIFRVDLDHTRNAGTISLVVLGDADHAAFDNVTFSDKKDTVLPTEDRGDTLHDQLNKLDSVWAYFLDKGNPSRNVARRLVALGQDRLAGVAGEEDNEPTGLHMSEGDATINGLIGTRELNKDRAMLFFTQQHGENNLFEVFPSQP